MKLSVGDRVTWGSHTVACEVMSVDGDTVTMQEYAWCEPVHRSDPDMDVPCSTFQVSVEEEGPFQLCDSDGNVMARQEYPTGIRLSDLIAPTTTRPGEVFVKEMDDLARILRHFRNLDVTIFDKYSGPAAAAARQALLQLRGIARNTLPIIEAHNCCAVPRSPVQPNGDDELA